MKQYKIELIDHVNGIKLSEEFTSFAKAISKAEKIMTAISCGFYEFDIKSTFCYVYSWDSLLVGASMIDGKIEWKRLGH